MSYVTRTATRDEVDLAVELARIEGWNPGLKDAVKFFAADPAGFFTGELDGEPVATISAVAYGSNYGFAGLYIVVPEHRSKGLGKRLWDHAMRHVAGRCVGLDAVVAQEATYERDGFATAYRSDRFQGAGLGTGELPAGVTPLGQIPFGQVLAYDRQCFPAAREAFLRPWVSDSGSTALAASKDGELAGFGVIRPCHQGFKIGPLLADSEAEAEALFHGLCASVPADEPVFLDVIQPNAKARALAGRHNMTQVFETVRMYNGGEPEADLGKLFGVTSFELG